MHIPLHFLAKFTRKCKLLPLGKNNPRHQNVLGATEPESSLSDKDPEWNTRQQREWGTWAALGTVTSRRGILPLSAA